MASLESLIPIKFISMGYFVSLYIKKKKKKKKIMNFILRICVPSTLHAVIQYTEILTVKLDLTLDISKQSTFHDQVHNPLQIESLGK